MLHPHIIVRKSLISGCGLVASKKIPCGTIVHITSNERVYTVKQYNNFSRRYKAVLRKYAYEDENENLVYLTNSAKFWNHCCAPNTAPFMDFDIAIRDILPGEEVTYDYAFLHPAWSKPMRCTCGVRNCRGEIRRESSTSKVIKRQQSLAEQASKRIAHVPQPLLSNRLAKSGKKSIIRL